MGAQAPQLKRWMFGFSPRSVRLILADRDAMVSREQERARTSGLMVNVLEAELQTMRAELGEAREWAERADSAEARATELETKMSELETKVAELETQAASFRSELEAAREELERRAEQAESDEAKIDRLENELDAAREALTHSPDVISASAGADLSVILGTAETELGRIIDRARRNSEEQLARTEQLRREMRSEVDRLVAWRDQVQPLVASVQASVRDATAKITEIPDLVMSALAPTTEAIGAVSAGLQALTDVSTEPTTVAPSPEGSSPSSDQVIDLEDTHPVWWNSRRP